jgi:hypothetical protein
LKRNILIGCFAYLLGMPVMLLHSQAIPTASRLGTISAGAGWFYSNPDYAQRKIQGMTFYSDFEFGRYWGAEGEIHYTVVAPTDITENHYVLGPRFVLHQKRVEEYAKILFGAAHFGLQAGSNPLPQTDTYFTYVMGGGVDVHVLRHLDIRAFDFEVQKWPGFPPNGLTPWSGSVGAAYVFH